MEWMVYESSDDATQVFVGIIGIACILFVIGFNLYYYLKDTFQK